MSCDKLYLLSVILAPRFALLVLIQTLPVGRGTTPRIVRHCGILTFVLNAVVIQPYVPAVRPIVGNGVPVVPAAIINLPSAAPTVVVPAAVVLVEEAALVT